MKKYLLLCTALVVASSAYALDCATPPTCAALGYTMSSSDCVGQFMLKCPFDNTLVFCGGKINDGAACQTAIADAVTVTSPSSSLSLTNTKYLYPETALTCSTTAVTLGAGSSLNSYCAFSDCYCATRPGYCNSDINLKDATGVNGIQLQSVMNLSLQGAVNFDNTTTLTAIDTTIITGAANGKTISIGPSSNIEITTLTPYTSTAAYSYNITVGTRANLKVTNIGVPVSYNASSHQKATLKVTLKGTTSAFIFKGTTYIGDGAPYTCTTVTSGAVSATLQVCR